MRLLSIIEKRKQHLRNNKHDKLLFSVLTEIIMWQIDHK